MKVFKTALPTLIILLLGANVSTLYAQTIPTSFSWTSTAALINPKSDATHNIIAVKDPSTVYYNGQYIVYASTANSAGNWGMEYLHFTNWANAGAATPYFMDSTSGFSGYHTAPQVFYFAPQNKWYLIFQSGQPQYSTNSDPTQPQNWTAPKNFFASQPTNVSNWIDFWIICDSTNAYLFFTGDNGNFYRSSTSLANFPNGFGNTTIVYTEANQNNLFEADNVYTVEQTGTYLANIECIGSDGHRFFRAFTASTLGGTWTPLGNTANLNTPFLGAKNVTFQTGVANWTSDFSSGGVVIDGDDQTDSINLNSLTFLFQGDNPNNGASSYALIPWSLGLATSKANTTTNPTATLTPTRTPTSTATRTNTATPTRTATSTLTATRTATLTFTATKTSTPTLSPTGTSTATKTNSPTGTPTFSSTPTKTSTPTQTASYTSTSSRTPTASTTNTPVNTSTFTSTPTFTSTKTNTPMNTSTSTPTSSPTPTNTPMFTNTKTFTLTSTSTASYTPSATATSSSTYTKTSTPTSSPTVTDTPIFTSTRTSTPTDSATPTLSPTGTPSSSPTASPSATGTSTAIPTSSFTATSTETWTPTATPSWTPSPTRTSTATPTFSSTATPTASATSTATSTETWTPTATPSWTPSPTRTSTATPTFSSTATPTASATSTATPPGKDGVVVYPNPATGPGPVTLQVTLTSPANHVDILVFTTAFREVNDITLSNLPVGLTDVAFPLTDKGGNLLANGLYYVEAVVNGNRLIFKLLVLR